MPTYEYICEYCGDQFEEFQSITAKPLKKCKNCGKMKLRRLIGTGSGVIFKGSGFYETDYRSENYKKAENKEKNNKSSKSDGKDKKTEAKKKNSKVKAKDKKSA